MPEPSYLANRLAAALGLLLMLALAWALSTRRRAVQPRVLLSGLALQFIFALLILKTRVGLFFFERAREVVAQLIASSDAGAEMVFGENFREHFFAFSVLPTIIFVSSLTALLFHFGILQAVVRGMAWVMVRVMDVSGTESLVAAANVFVGQTEAPLLIRPYLATMTRSELMAMMTGGLATIAGGVMAAYASFGADPGHLLAASVMSAPAALVIAKLMIPETEESPTKGRVRVDLPRQDANALDALCRGATEGLQLALNVAAMLIAMTALVALLNYFLAYLVVAGEPLSLERMLGWVGAPVAWLLGVEWADARHVGMLLGKKTVLNEFLAYLDLRELRETLSPRSFVIATYALCGFANFASIAIQIGGLAVLVPGRRAELARLGLRAMLGGTLAAFMTAAIAAILI